MGGFLPPRCYFCGDEVISLAPSYGAARVRAAVAECQEVVGDMNEIRGRACGLPAERSRGVTQSCSRAPRVYGSAGL